MMKGTRPYGQSTGERDKVNESEREEKKRECE